MRIWRMAKGLTQAQLANRLGVTFQQLQKYEIAANRIPTGRLVKIAAILGVPVSALFHGADTQDPAQALLADQRSFRLAQAFAAIKNNEFRVSLLNMVETIAASVSPSTRRR